LGRSEITLASRFKFIDDHQELEGHQIFSWSFSFFAFFVQQLTDQNNLEYLGQNSFHELIILKLINFDQILQQNLRYLHKINR
jgi:hypothetical protein